MFNFCSDNTLAQNKRLSTWLGEGSKAIGHVRKLQSQGRGKVSGELVVLGDNIANGGVHGLRSLFIAFIADRAHPMCIWVLYN